jgi:hypothetical protein
MPRPKVFVVQSTLQRDAAGALVPKFDLSPAEKFGEVVFLLSPSAAPWTKSVVAELHEKLSYMQDGDYLLPMGNPILMCMAFAIATQYVDQVQMLQWSGKNHQYTPLTVGID